MDPGESGFPSHNSPTHPGSLSGIPVGNGSIDHPSFAVSSIMLPRGEGEAATMSADSVAVIFRCV